MGTNNDIIILKILSLFSEYKLWTNRQRLSRKNIMISRFQNQNPVEAAANVRL